MKLITAIAALALLAGSMDVEAQKRGKANNPPGGGKTPGTHQKAPEGAETGHPQFSPAAHIAIRAFSELDKEDVQDLVEAAKEGDADAREELQLDQLGAIETLIDALEDEGERKLIMIGIMLAHAHGMYIDDSTSNLKPPGSGASLKGAEAEGVFIPLENNYFEFQALTLLENLHRQLKEDNEKGGEVSY